MYLSCTGTMLVSGWRIEYTELGKAFGARQFRIYRKPRSLPQLPALCIFGVSSRVPESDKLNPAMDYEFILQFCISIIMVVLLAWLVWHRPEAG